MTYLHKTCWCP